MSSGCTFSSVFDQYTVHWPRDRYRQTQKQTRVIATDGLYYMVNIHKTLCSQWAQERERKK